MKIHKIVCSAALATVLALNLANIGFAKEITVRLDDKTVECPVPARIENGRTMVPMRAIFEAFGMSVEWNNEDKSISAVKGDTQIKMTVGEKEIEVNGEKTELDVAPYIASDTTMVPVRAVSESLDATVSWNDEKRRVEITTKEYEMNKDEWKNNVGSIDVAGLKVTGEGVSVSDNVIKITKGGDFTVTGENDNAMIHVDTNEKVKLRLSGVKITNPTGPAIFFENVGKALITVSKGTENFLADGEEYSVDAKATLFSNDDIEIKGEGTLTVTSVAHHALAGDDDIKIEEGNLVLVSEKKDGIHANDTVKILGGKIDITSYGDGIQAEEDVVIEDGEISIKTTGEVTEDKNGGFMPFGDRGDKGNRGNRENGEGFDKNNMGRQDGAMNNSERTETMTPPEKPEGMGEMMPQGGMTPPEKPEGMGEMMPQGGMTPPEKPEGMPGGMGEMTPQGGMNPFENSESDKTEDSDSVSTKGIKAELAMTIKGGSITIDSADHAIHCAGEINITGGEINLTSQKGKGISAHGDVVIDGGEINVLKSTEGIESKANMTINGGEINIEASDDGINTGGTNGRDVISRNDKEKDTGHDLTINGGTVFVNAQGDGLDSNGKMIITGGSIIVEGSTNNGNGALDSGGFIKVDGGELLALGASGMAEAPDKESGQASFKLVTETTIERGTKIVISDKNGKELLSYTTQKTGNSIVYSSDKLKVGETYTVKAGDKEYSVELTDNATTVGQAGFGGFGGRGQR